MPITEHNATDAVRPSAAIKRLPAPKFAIITTVVTVHWRSTRQSVSRDLARGQLLVDTQYWCLLREEDHRRKEIKNDFGDSRSS